MSKPNPKDLDLQIQELLNTRGKWSDLLAEMLDVLEAEFKRRPLNSPSDNAALAVMALAHHFGGRYFYIPTGDRLKRAVTYHQIRLAVNSGQSKDVVAAKFGVTRSWINMLLQQDRVAPAKAEQGILPL